MAFQRIPAVFQVNLIYGFGSGPDIENTFYVRDIPGARGTAEMSTLADAFQAWWEANVKPIQVDDITLRSIKVIDQDGQFGGRFEKNVQITGTNATTPAPSAVAALVHYNGNPGSAPRKGTLFHPGLTEAQIDADQITNATSVALAAAYNALRTAAGFTVSQALVVVSRYSGFTIVARPNGTTRKKPTPRTPATYNTIASTTVPLRYGVQKRRRPSPL